MEFAVLCWVMRDLEELAAARSLTWSTKRCSRPSFWHSLRPPAVGIRLFESRYLLEPIYSKRPSQSKRKPYCLDLY